MAAYVGLLRGINVSGHHVMKMTDLKSILSESGLKGISTYLQSGNIVFESALDNCSELEVLISKAIYKGFGFKIKVKVIEKDTFMESFKMNPFLIRSGIDTKQLYYLHLMGVPDVNAFEALQSDPRYPEEMILQGELIYFYYPNGYGRSKLHGGIVEKKIKVSLTARNHNTMKKLATMLD